jgi:hypothetical protein
MANDELDPQEEDIRGAEDDEFEDADDLDENEEQDEDEA